MCDPVKRPLTWNKKFYVYAEQHGIHDVFQALMKELAIWRPDDPVQYIKDEIKRIGKGIYAPKVFMLGPEPLTPLLAEGISNHCGAKFFSVKSIIQSTTPDIRVHLACFARGEDSDDPHLRKLLIATIARRLVAPDCIKSGYVLYGFPQSRTQALMAQSMGLIPNQVFVLMPEGPPPPSPDTSRPSTKSLPGTAKSQPPGTANSAQFTDIFAPEKLKIQYTPAELLKWEEYFRMKDTASAYAPETLRVQGYDNWMQSDPHDLEAEFLGVLVTKPSTGAPWIPRILFIGPPASGKRTLAEKVASKYRVPAFSWIDIIRGEASTQGEHSDECKMYLDNLTPLSDECVTALLQRRLYRDDCMKRGFVMYGFPETANQATVLDKVALTPNRVFLVSCPVETSRQRIDQKKTEIMNRRTPNHPIFYRNPSVLEAEPDDGETGMEGKESFSQNPYSPEAINGRFDFYNQNLPGVIRHYGSNMMYIDGSEELEVVTNFVMTSIQKPPNVRFE